MTSQDYLNTGIVIILLCMGINRFLGERNLANLNSEEKSLLVDEFCALRLYPSLISIGLLITILVFANSFKEYGRNAGFVVILLMAALLGVTMLLAKLKMNRLAINPRYKKAYFIQQAINLIGLSLGFGFVTFGIMMK